MTEDRRHGEIIAIRKKGRRDSDLVADPHEVLDAIDNLGGNLDHHIEQFDAYVRGDLAWKTASQPAIDNMKNLTNGWKLLIHLCIGVAAIGGAIIMIFRFLSYRS